jgi:hypothetical protein
MKVLFLLFLSIPLFSVEIILKNDEGYICDLIWEDEKIIRVKFKEKIYEFPKKEIEYRDDLKRGAHKGYKLSRFTLADGSVLKGQIAEEKEDFITVQTRFGFLKLDKPSIKNLEKAKQKEYFPDEDFLEKTYRTVKSNMGLSALSLGLTPTIPDSTNTASGGSLFFEPSFLYVNSSWRFGLKSEFLSTGGKEWIEFINNSFYVQRSFKFSERLDFYFNFGIGGVYMKYHSGTKLIAEGLNPSVFSEFGWQGLKFGNFGFRFGLRNLVSIENKTLGGIGFEMGVLYSL